MTTGLSVNSSTAAGKLDLSWTAPAQNGGAITGYDVHYTSSTTVDADAETSGADPSIAWVVTSHSGTTASWSITGLSNNKAYRVRVRAKNEHGSGAWSVPQSGMTRAASTDATLSALSATSSTSSGGSFTALNIGTFAAGTTSYTVSVARSTTHVKLTPTVTNSDATVKVGKGASRTTVSSGSASGALALNVGANALSVEVTAEDGTTTKTYTVTVTRAASADATLSSLSATSSTSSGGAFSALSIGTFVSSTTSYTVSVANTITHVKLTPTVTDSDATVKVGLGASRTPVSSGSASGALALNVGANALNVEVTAEDGTTQRTYTVTVTRAASTDATLSALTASTSTSADRAFGALNIGTFAAGTTSYSASVAHSTTHVKLMPTVTDSDATVKVGKGASRTAVLSGSESEAIALDVGDNELSVEVTAEDGTTTRTYTITVTRASSTDATLSALSATSSASADGAFTTLNIGTFASSTTSYTASVAHSITHVKLTPTVTDSDATVKVGKGSSRTTVSSGSASGAIALEVGANELNVEVTAEDGTTTRTYTVTVTRAAATDATLSVSPNPVQEGGMVTVTVTLSSAAPSDMSIPIRLTPGTAEEGEYGSLSSISIPSGSISGTGTITTTEDGDPNDETFTVLLGSALPTGITAGSPNSVEVTIQARSTRSVSLSASPNPVKEGQPVTVTVALSESLADDVTIPLTIIPGTAESDDFDHASPVKITIPAGQTEAEHPLNTYEDDDSEDESFTVAIDGENLPAGIALGSPASADITITDPGITITDPDMRPTISLNVDPTSVEEGGALTIILALSESLTGDVTIPLNVTPGTAESGDFDHASPVKITIPAGQTEAEHPLNTYEDDDSEDESFTVAIDGENLPDGIALGSPASVDITITDPGITITDPDMRPAISLSVDPTSVEEGGAVTVTITLSESLADDVTIPLTVTPGTAESDDFDHASPVKITIPAGQTEAEHPLNTYEDDDSEDESFTVAIDGENLPPGIALGSPASANITITDTDPPGILAPVFLEVDEGQSETVQVALMTLPSSDVRVTITGYEGTDLKPDPPILTFTQDGYNTPQTVIVTTSEDTDLFNDEVTLTLEASGGGYNEVSHTLVVTIRDNRGVSIEEESPVSSMILWGNYPNPVSEFTKIVFDLPEPAYISVRVTDLLGRTEQTIPYKWYGVGTGHTVEIDTENLTSGIYYYTLRVKMGDHLMQRSKAMSIVR